MDLKAAIENSLENVSEQRKLIALRILMNAALRLIKKRKEIKEAA